MKVALCLQGLSIGSNDKGNSVDSHACMDLIYKNIIEPNNADVFIHTWNTNESSTQTLTKLTNQKKLFLKNKRCLIAQTANTTVLRVDGIRR